MNPLVKILTQNKYSIHYRVFKDAQFYRGWFNNMREEWTIWYNYKEGGYANIKDVMSEYNLLEKSKPYLKNKREYKVVKNEC